MLGDIKMRETLERIREGVLKGEASTGNLAWIVNLCDERLAMPPRNCDVGTAEEHAQRFHDFCIRNSSSIDGMCDSKCPCISSPDKCHCLCKWAQMPYLEGDK